MTIGKVDEGRIVRFDITGDGFPDEVTFDTAAHAQVVRDSIRDGKLSLVGSRITPANLRDWSKEDECVKTNLQYDGCHGDRGWTPHQLEWLRSHITAITFNPATASLWGDGSAKDLQNVFRTVALNGNEFLSACDRTEKPKHDLPLLYRGSSDGSRTVEQGGDTWESSTRIAVVTASVDHLTTMVNDGVCNGALGLKLFGAGRVVTLVDRNIGGAPIKKHFDRHALTITDAARPNTGPQTFQFEKGSSYHVILLESGVTPEGTIQAKTETDATLVDILQLDDDRIVYALRFALNEGGERDLLFFEDTARFRTDAAGKPIFVNPHTPPPLIFR